MNTRVVKKCVVALSAMAMLLGGVAQAAILTPSSVTASASYSSSPAIHLIDSSGLSENTATGTHDSDLLAQTMWMSNGGTVANEWVIFDLGEAHDLTHAYIWQMNQVHPTAGDLYLTRGTATMDIWVSSDSNPLTATFTNLGLTTLAVASGTSTDPAQVVDLIANNVRLVKFDIKTALSGNPNEYVGLSEVRFEGEVTSGTIAFSTLGASNITATAASPYATVNTNLTASWLVWDTSDKGTIDLQTWTGKSGDMDAQSPGEVTGNATGLNADTQYSFRFYGENSTVPTNGWSSVATFASALSAAQKPVFTNQDASVISVTLEWTDNAATETSYILRRSDVGSGGPYTVIATLDADVTTYEDTEVLIETTYYYQLAATNEVNGSSTAFSACVTDATTPGLPPDQPRIPVAYDGKASWTRTTGVNTYDASGSDKLVVAVAGEHHFPNNPGGNVDGITYNGQTLIKAVERNPEVGNLTAVDIWYLDNPASYAGAGTIVVSFNGNSWCATAIGLSDTAEGVGETAVASSSASLTSVIPTANSMVISALGTGGAGNTASPAPQAMSPMTVIDGVVYSGNYAGLSTGYQSIASPSVETFSFNTAKTDVSTIAAVFPGVLKPPPAGTVIILI